MAFLQTAADLKVDALQLAGEPTDGSSTYDGRVFEYLNRVQNALISGGQLGSRVLRPVDWWWARAYPRGVVSLAKPFNDPTGVAIPGSFTQGSTVVSLGSIVATDLSNYRVKLTTAATPSQAQPYILSNAGSSITLRTPWLDATQTSITTWIAYQAEYDLPTDFARFSSPLYVPMWPYELDVVDPRQLEQTYPFGSIAQSVPVLGALVTERKLRFSHIPDQNYAAEFEYIVQPDHIEDGVTPLIPERDRAVLSLGAAYLLQYLRGDSDQDRVLAMFTDAYRVMADQQRGTLAKASSRYGRVIPRTWSTDMVMRTVSGVPVY